MSNVYEFDQRFRDLEEQFQIAVRKLASKITLKGLLAEINESSLIHPRLESYDEVERFQAGSHLDFRILNWHYELHVERKRLSLRRTDYSPIIQAFSGSRVTCFYDSWCEKIQKVKKERPDPPF